MTRTARELWNSKDFLKKRILEQNAYKKEILIRFQQERISKSRYWELFISSNDILTRLITQLNRIK